MRASRESVNIRIAQIISERATCSRLQVGAVITQNNKIIGTGYNGPGKDEMHCNDFICKTDEPCKRAVHAEANAIINAGLTGLVDNRNNYVIYCTHQPCYECAKKIIRAGIQTVYYLNPYRDIKGLLFLKAHKIKVTQIDGEGNPQ